MSDTAVLDRTASKYFAGVDIGGTKMTVSLANEGGIIHKIYQGTRKEGPDSRVVPQQVHEMIQYLLSRHEIPENELYAVGISTCSPFEMRDDGEKVVKTPNICHNLAKERAEKPLNDWTEIPLEGELSKYYKRLVVENDCVSAAVAEHTFGALVGEDDCAYVTWSTGIGGGIYADGRIVRGKNGNAGHVGHIIIVKGGELCGCGQRGCLEAESSGTAVAIKYAKALEKLNIPRGDFDAKYILSAYRIGDETAKDVVEDVGRCFATGLISMTNSYDTRVFAIGGSMMNDRDVLMPIVEDEYRNHSFKALSKGVEFRLPGLGKYLGDMAALSLVMPNNWIPEWREKKPWKHAPEVEKLS